MNIKPLPPVTRLLAALLKVNVGVLIVAVVGDVYSWYEYSHLAPGVDTSETLLPSDILNMLVGIIQVLIAIFLGVAFLRWIYRANKNLHVLSSKPMTFSPGWSVGWYFIPIANLFKPYQPMKEIWAVAHRGMPSDSSILGWWWFLWIVSNFLPSLTLKFVLKAEDAQSYTISAVADAVSDGIDIVLNVVALVLVTVIARAYCVNYVECAAPNGGPATQLGNSGVTEGPPSVSGIVQRDVRGLLVLRSGKVAAWPSTRGLCFGSCEAHRIPTFHSKILCGLLRYLGFDERIRGSHHIFTKEGVEEILNLQPRGAKGKPYQVKQVRAVILRYKISGGSDEQ